MKASPIVIWGVLGCALIVISFRVHLDSLG
jgi:hypothetical protein